MASASLQPYSEFRGRIILIRAMPDSLRAVRHCIFTGRVVEESGICSAGFLRKHPRCGERAHPLRLLTAFASISPKGRALGSPRNVSSSSAKCVGELKASPGRGKLSPQVTDEGAPFAATCRYPSSGATRHLFPLLSLRDIFPRRGGDLSPRGEGFSSCGKVSGSSAKCAVSPEPLPLGEVARRKP